MLDAEAGEAAVRLARFAVDASTGRPSVTEPARLPPVFTEPRGAFVTLRTWPDAQLRGCIGYPTPVMSLGEAIRRAATAAALEDPRFPPVNSSEVDRLVVEVSVLSVPEPVPSTDRPGAIVVGRDGVQIARGRRAGLLLPQVAPEMGWSSIELLDGVCEKAGLPPGAWRDPSAALLRFEAQVFEEVRPRGPVVPAPTSNGGPLAPRT